MSEKKQINNVVSKNQVAAPIWDIIAVALLVWAALLLHGTAGYHRYSYYNSLRNIVSLAWLVAAFRFYYHRWLPATIIGAVIVVLFNPIAPITMRKWQWQPYDFWTMILSIAGACALCALLYASGRSSLKMSDRESKSA